MPSHVCYTFILYSYIFKNLKFLHLKIKTGGRKTKDSDFKWPFSSFWKILGFFSLFLMLYIHVWDFSEKAMAPHSSTLAWKIPWTEEPGRLQSMKSPRVGHDWATSLSLFLSCIGEGNGNPLQCPCLENPRDRGAWGAAVYGVAQSRTRLKRLSSSRTKPAISPRYAYNTVFK